MNSLFYLYTVIKLKVVNRFNKYFKLEKLVNEEGNEMWRVCWKGYNKHRWFIRLDWGSKGWRITKR